MEKVNLHIGKAGNNLYKIGYFIVNGKTSKFNSELPLEGFGDLGVYLRNLGINKVDIVNSFHNLPKVRQKLVDTLKTPGAIALVDEQIALFGPNNQLESVKEEELAVIYKEITKAFAA